MEVINLVVNVPYQVEISSNDTSLDKCTAEFCITKSGHSINIPLKRISNGKLEILVKKPLADSIGCNKQQKYKLYVYLDNARFLSDEGSFKLLNEESVKVKHSKEKKEAPKTSAKDEKVDVVMPDDSTKSIKLNEDEKVTNAETIVEEVITEEDKTVDSKVKEILAEYKKPVSTPEASNKSKFFSEIEDLKRKNKLREEEQKIQQEKIQKDKKIKDIINSVK